MRWGLPWPGPQLAERAEATGFDAFCSGEFSDRDAYVTTTEMALGTSKAMIGAPIAIQVLRPRSAMSAADTSVEQLRDHLGELTEAGVSHFVARTPANSVGAATDTLAWFGEQFMEMERAQ